MLDSVTSWLHEKNLIQKISCTWNRGDWGSLIANGKQHDTIMVVNMTQMLICCVCTISDTLTNSELVLSYIGRSD